MARAPDGEPKRLDAGLCDRCVHQRLVPNRRGSVFSLCERAKAEPDLFTRYPALPVTACRGYAQRGVRPAGET